ncbi:hypothetical protein BDB01DRAFT_846818 [Pilobolus umbonatus]|nr:hypothetical protein BDB01DRAFT_846818 [Pilobolus umbonatus]
MTDPMFKGVYRSKQSHTMYERAQKAGVEKIFITGTHLVDSKEAIDEIETHEKSGLLYSTVGCHPTRSTEFDEHPNGPQAYFDELLQLARSSSSVVAIGECGLDYDRLHFCPKETQKKYFEMQFDLAQKTGLPMFLHNRNTGDDFYELVRRNRHKFKHGVVHSFTGTMEEMKKLIELDLFIGVNGCSLKTQESIEVVKEIPVNRLMIETDAPWCDIRPTHASYAHLKNMSAEQMALYSPPAKKKEKFEMGCMVKSRNEPCTIGLVLHIIASIRQVNAVELSEVIWKNTADVFLHRTKE